MQKTIPVSAALTIAFLAYIAQRDNHAKEENHSFDKEKYRGTIFSVAKALYGEKLVYMESAAASYFFHIKEGDKVSVWETHLTEGHRKSSKDFTVLQYSFLNNDYKEEVKPLPVKTSWFKRFFRF